MRPLPVENGKRVKEARTRLELTQAELAERLELEEVTVRAIESGRRGLSLETLLRVAEALGVRPGALIDRQTDTPGGVGHEAAKIVDSLNPAWQRAALRILREIQHAAKAKATRGG